MVLKALAAHVMLGASGAGDVGSCFVCDTPTFPWAEMWSMGGEGGCRCTQLRSPTAAAAEFCLFYLSLYSASPCGLSQRAYP